MWKTTSEHDHDRAYRVMEERFGCFIICVIIFVCNLLTRQCALSPSKFGTLCYDCGVPWLYLHVLLFYEILLGTDSIIDSHLTF